jgi:hypothetical protein
MGYTQAVWATLMYTHIHPLPYINKTLNALGGNMSVLGVVVHVAILSEH